MERQYTNRSPGSGDFSNHLCFQRFISGTYFDGFGLYKNWKESSCANPVISILCFFASNEVLYDRIQSQSHGTLDGRVKMTRNRSIQPVDMSAFYALIDRFDEALLREKLSRAEFFHLKRLRIRAIWKYVRRIAENSVVVRRIVVSSQHDPDVNIAKTAKEIVKLARQLRMQCVIAFAKLTLEYIFPAICLKHRS